MGVCYRILADDEGYRVGSDGSIWTRKIRVKGNRSGWTLGPRWRRLKPAINRDGYPIVEIRGKTLRVHHLILKSFIGPRPEGMQACHVNDDPQDNRLSNLKWGTARENVADARLNGRLVINIFMYDQYPKAKLNPDKAREIRRRHAAGETHGLLAREFRVDPKTIWHIVRNLRWRHVSDASGDTPIATPVEAAKVVILDRLRGGNMGLVGEMVLYAEFRKATLNGRTVFEDAIRELERAAQIICIKRGDDGGHFRAHMVGYLGGINFDNLTFEIPPEGVA
jgi:hypothetical protein